jgi:hypothetical protein
MRECLPVRRSKMEYGLPFDVTERDGNVYRVDLFQRTMRSVDELWEKFSRYKVLFVDETQGNKEAFFSSFFLSPNTILLAVDDVGVVYATHITPGYDASVHYLFWDRKTAGRERILLQSLKWLMEQFGLVRVNVEIPDYAYAALRRSYRMGFRLEGIKRHALRHGGKWRDQFFFGVLASEITDSVIEDGAIPRTREEKNWYGLLRAGKSDRIMNAIARR